MAFKSKHLFFHNGVQDHVPANPLDCTICTEPLLCRSKKRTASDLGDQSAPASKRPRKSHHKARGLGDQSAPAPKKTFELLWRPLFEQRSLALLTGAASSKGPEPAVRISSCGHIFGRHCLETWCKTARTCPLCRAELFKRRVPLQLKLLPPTREQRMSFARWMRGMFPEGNIASKVRRNVMSGWVRKLMTLKTVLDLELDGYTVKVVWQGDEKASDSNVEEVDDLKDATGGLEISAYTEWSLGNL